MSTTTQNEIRRIIEESEVKTEAAVSEKPIKLGKNTVVIQAPVKTPAKSGKMHKVVVKKDQPVCVDFSALDADTYDVVMWDQRLGGSILKRMTLDRPKHLPADFSLKFYTRDYAAVIARFDVGLVPTVKDGDVMMGKDKIGTTDELVPDFPRESGIVLAVISDFSVAKACDTDIVKPLFNYAFFRKMDKKLTLFASDSRHLCYTTSGFVTPNVGEMKIDGAFIPRTALEAKSDITLLYVGNHYLVSYDNVTLRYHEDGIQVLSDGVLKEVTKIEKGAAFEMGLAMQHIKFKAEDKSASHRINVFLDDNGAHMNLVNPDVENVARIPVIVRDGSAASFGINAAYLLEGITFTGNTILYQNKEQPESKQMFLKSDKGDRVSVIMPMLIRQSDKEADITAEEM